MTSITNGLYEITSALSDDLFIGRPSPEDMSLLPKTIVAFQRGEGEAPRPWVAIETGEDIFILKATNDHTADVDGKLQAVLTESPAPTKWRVIPVPQNGENAYVVTVAGNEGNGWALDPHGDGSQPFQPIFVRPLVVSLSYPPIYPRFEVFIFKRILLEDQ